MNDYEARANGVVNFLCGARSDAAFRFRVDFVYAWCAYLAEERMPLFDRADEKCGFYADAVHMAGDALWWVERRNAVEAKRRLVTFYRFLDEVVDERLVVRR